MNDASNISQAGAPVKLTSFASCAGCAGKLPYGALSDMLRGLPVSKDPNLLVGSDHYSDAGVYRISADLALVQTTDFFPPIVDDPFTFGQIAAANSLSDCYAMGGRPINCLNIVCFPDKDLPIEVLGAILRGGADRVTLAGAVTLGGHSLRDTEIKFGLAVTGLVHPEKYMSNAGARPGDCLVLTKPIGSGILAGAAKTGKITPSDLEPAIETMRTLNAAASRVAMDLGIRGSTDVTGYGLIGHAWEMAGASKVTLEIDASRVPLMAGALELARAGGLTRAWKTTLEQIADGFRADGVEEALVRALADAQTSGGLLLAAAPQRADDLLSSLAGAGVSASEIGRVHNHDGTQVRLRH